MTDIEGLGVDPFSASASMLLDAADRMEPGPLQQSLLLMIDRSALTADEAVRFLDLHERVTAWWSALQTDALIAAAGPNEAVTEFLVLDGAGARERRVEIADIAREEVAAALRWSPTTAQQRIDEARLLAGPLARTREALSHGEISTSHARLICQAAQRLSTQPGADDAEDSQAAAVFATDCAELQDRILPTARRHGLSRTRRCADRAVESIDAAGQAARRARARCTRDVYVTDTTDGISTLVARLDALTARAILGAVQGAAADERVTTAATIGERRAEALAALVGVRPITTPTTGDSPVTVQVHLDISLIPAIPASAIIEGNHSLTRDRRTPLPASTGLMGDGGVIDLAGLLPFLDDPALEIHARPAVVDDSGHLLDLGRRRYQVSGALRRFLQHRDTTCRFPECGRSAQLCQIDHATAWDDGGGTDVTNLGALCTRHHQLKTHAGWRITSSKVDGSCTWVSPQGRSYDHDPPPF